MLRTREQVRVLGPGDRDAFIALAEQDPVVNVFADYRARLTNLDERWLGGQVWGRFESDRLVAGCHLGANLVPVQCTPDDVGAFADVALRRRNTVGTIVGPAQVVAAHIQWLFEASFQALRRVDEALGARPDLFIPGTPGDLGKAVEGLPAEIAIWVFDRAGVPLLTEAAAAPVADQPYFQALAAGDDWHISALLGENVTGQQAFAIGHRIERDGQFGFELVEELAPRGRGRIRGARAADEDDAGGEGIGIFGDNATSTFCPHWPSAADSKSCANHGVKKCLPACAGSARIVLALRLLEGIINRNRKGWM